MSAPAPERAELAALARSLAAHLARAGRLGLTAADRPPERELDRARSSGLEQRGPGAATSADARDRLVPRERPASAPAGPGGGAQARPPGASAASGASGASGAPLESTEAGAARLAPSEVGARAARNRELAAACSDLETLRAAVAACTACPLARTRTQTVFADGNGSAGVLFVGEGPGFHEDQQGVPFVGRAGALLTDIITKGMGLPREEVYIANVVKCRPPENRDPAADEKAICTPWLDRQIELVDPRVIVPLGRHAAGHVLGSEASMGALRARVHEVRGRSVVPTYHPAYLLRSPGQKKACWEDIQRAMAILGLEPPSRPGPAGGADREPAG